MPVRAIPAAGGLALAVIITLVLLLPSSASGLTFTVTTTADSGNGSLRDAIEDANSSAGLDVIDFDPNVFPPGTPATISPATELPDSTDPTGLTIDGTGAGVIIDGSGLAGAERGLDFRTSAGVGLTDVTVRNLTVQNFPGDGIRVCGGDETTCGNEVTDTLIDSIESNSNGGQGIVVTGAPNLRSTVVDSTASHNTARGVNLNGGTPDDLVDATVTGVTANNNGIQGINLNASADNIGSTVTNSTALLNGNYGININAGDETRDATVANPVVNGNGNGGVNINAGDSNIDSTITGGEANGNSQGANINAGDQLVRPTIATITASNNTSGTGIEMNAGDELLDGVVANVNATGNADEGILINAGVYVPDRGPTISNSTSSGNAYDGLWVNVPDAEITDNVLNGNGESGVQVVRTGAIISGNTISGNAEHGVDGANDGFTSVIGNTITANLSLASAVRVPGFANEISDNIISGNAGYGVDGSFAGASNFRILGNTVTGNGGVGIATGGGESVIRDNLVDGNGGIGIRTAGPDDTIERNTVIGNGGDGITVFNSPGEVHFNRVFGNGGGLTGPASIAALSEPAGIMLNTQYNWWGCNEGPSSSQCDNVSGMVDFEPWLTLGISADPNPSVKDLIGKVFGSVTEDSTGSDTSIDDTIRDGTIISFDTDVGFLDGSPAEKPTLGGVAESPFVSDTSGTAHITATLDNETVTLELLIVLAAPSQTPLVTDSPTGSPLPSGQATPTPTPTGAQSVVWGDANCSGQTDPVDSLLTLRSDAGLSVNTGDCPPFGTDVSLLASTLLWGDFDCSGAIDPIDSLKILRFDAGLSVAQGAGCPSPGGQVSLSLNN